MDTFPAPHIPSFSVHLTFTIHLKLMDSASRPIWSQVVHLERKPRREEGDFYQAVAAYNRKYYGGEYATVSGFITDLCHSRVEQSLLEGVDGIREWGLECAVGRFSLSSLLLIITLQKSMHNNHTNSRCTK